MIWSMGSLRGAARLGTAAAMMTAGVIGSVNGLAAQTAELVSRVDPSQVSDTGMGSSSSQSAGNIFSPRTAFISDDGRYQVFLSSAPNLVQGQQEREGGGTDVFLRDLVAGTTALVSHTPGSPLRVANGDSLEAVISGDGRYVAFLSKATDLVPGRPPLPPVLNTDGDLFLWDRATDTTTLVAAHHLASLRFVSLNADGRYTLSLHDAPDLVPGQQGGAFPEYNVFLYDRTENRLRLVSHTAASTLTTGDGFSRLPPSISADGRYVAFVSSSSDLVAGQPAGLNLFLFDRDSGLNTAVGPAIEAVLSADGRYLVARSLESTYLYERDTRTTIPLSVPAPEDPYEALAIDISDDGRFVALISDPGRLVPAQPGSASRGLYLYDRIARAFTLASRRHGSPVDSVNDIAYPSISADGRLVAYLSLDPHVVAGQTDINGSWDLFVFDRSSGNTTLASHTGSSATTTGDDSSSAPAISANGTRVAFGSAARNLVAGVTDRNDDPDVFAFEVASGNTDLVSRRAPGMLSLASNFGSRAKALSADGRWVAFESESPFILAGQADSNFTTDVFLQDRATRSTILVSRSSGSPTRTAAGRSINPAISADGRYVVFHSDALDLAPVTSTAGGDFGFFLFDRLAGTIVPVSERRSQDSSFKAQPRISQDGRWVAFEAVGDVLLWDRTTGVATRVAGSSSGPVLSADGRYVAFASFAADVVPGQIDTNETLDLFLYDRTTGRTVLVSHTQDSMVTAASVSDSFPLATLSADGRFVAFGGWEDEDSPQSLYLYDRTLGTNERIAAGYSPTISGDGRYVAFLSDPELQVDLYDRVTKTVTLVTRSVEDGGAANGAAISLAINADGRYVAFESDATDLVPGQPVPDTFDPFGIPSYIFRFDRVTGTMELVSRPVSATPFGYSESPLLSASGRQIAFTSSSQLVAEDLNVHSDAYAFGPVEIPSGPTPLPACGLLDTRRRAERPVLSSNVRREVQVRGRCGVPATAKQVVVKVTVFNPSGKGNLRFYPGAVTAAPSGILRFERAQTRTESFTLPVGTDGKIAILPFVAGKGTVHAMVEVNGYSQ